jgi:signal peptidase II
MPEAVSEAAPFIRDLRTRPHLEGAGEVWHPGGMNPISRGYRLGLVSLVLAGTVGCDQATKQLAISHLRDEPAQSFLGGVVRLVFAENPGAFLSLGGRLPPALRFGLLTIGVGLILLIALFYLLKSRQLGRLQIVALALLAGGGMSNWYDRLVNDGRVVDFMVLGIGRLRTGVFNVADVAIMLGIGLMLLGSRRGDSLGEHRGDAGPGATA